MHVSTFSGFHFGDQGYLQKDASNFLPIPATPTLKIDSSTIHNHPKHRDKTGNLVYE